MRILVAEDDLHQLFTKTLWRKETLRFSAMSGDTCIRTYLNHLPSTLNLFESTSTVVKPSYDVVILDYALPDMNGMDIAKEILEINSHQRVIFSSAYVQETSANFYFITLFFDFLVFSWRYSLCIY
jgi:CheY-like chemotaxis protein